VIRRITVAGSGDKAISVPVPHASQKKSLNSISYSAYLNNKWNSLYRVSTENEAYLLISFSNKFFVIWLAIFT
jgi:hypothetical protein